MAKSPNLKPPNLKPPSQSRVAPARIETQRAADAVAAHLEQMLVQGVLRPGEKLAAERDLAEKLGVSRPTLRDAMARLAERGLLVLGRDGARVAQYLAPFSEPLAELFADKPRVAADYFEFRRALEAEAARLAAERATDLDRRAIADVVKRMKDAHRADDAAREAALDVDLHLAIYEAAHNLVVLHVMRVLSELLRNNIFYNRDQLFRRAGAREKLLEQHLAIAEAILAGDARRAAAAASAHIAFVFETVEALRRDEHRLATSLQRLNRVDLVAG
ncbi:MAG: FCD domain-containing protein [Rhizobiales bacterium]|nr:FCD domain-containing protein [Hyphomicrobiales bacterium]